jgi:O-antigen/teichoic acid export membrane protein
MSVFTPLISSWKRLRHSRAALNMTTSYFSFASTSLWAIVSIPVAVKYLPRDAIGLWSVTNAFLSYLVWMDFGIAQATGRLIAPAVASRDQLEINRWWTATSITLWLQALLLLLVGAALTPLIIHLLAISGPSKSDAYLIFLSAVAVAAFGLPLRNVPGLLTAQERFHWVPLVQGLVPWCNFAIFYSLLKSGWGIKAYPVAMAGSAAFNWICYSTLVRVGPNRPHFDRLGINASRLKQLFKFSGSLMAVGLTDSMLNSLPAMILARMGGLGLVPVYNFTSRGPFLGSNIIARTYQAFQPGWQSCYVSDQRREFLKKHEVAGFFSLGLATFGASFVITVNPVLVEFLAGHDFFAGTATNAWFAVGMIAFPMGAYFQSLLALSGSMGKSAAVFLAKVPLGFGAALLGWHQFGMAGLAAVFALLPLVNGIYGYTVGTRRCGFRRHEISPKVAILTLASMALTLLIGIIVGSSYRWSGSFEFVGKTVRIPAIEPLLPALVLALAGVAFAWHAMRLLRGK